MAAEYYLPCSACGAETKVEARAAGQQRRCSCGAVLEVPTLRDLRALRPADAEAAAPKATWDRRRAVILIGVLVALFSLLATGLAYRRVVYQRPPVTISAQDIASDSARVEQLSPFDAVVNWSNLRGGPYIMVEVAQPDQENLKNTAKALLGLGLAGALAGLATLLGALFFMPSTNH